MAADVGFTADDGFAATGGLIGVTALGLAGTSCREGDASVAGGAGVCAATGNGMPIMTAMASNKTIGIDVRHDAAEIGMSFCIRFSGLCIPYTIVPSRNESGRVAITVCVADGDLYGQHYCDGADALDA